MILQKLGGDYQLLIRNPEDLEAIDKLDEAHWMVTSAPCESFSCDPAFLKYLDRDGDGRIVSNDLKAAVQWLFSMLADRDSIASPTSAVKINHINTTHEDGKALRAAAERILSNLRLCETDEISLENVQNRRKILSMGAQNGDGVIPATSGTDPEFAQFIKDIIRTVGSVQDASGEPGVAEKHLEKFLSECRCYSEWLRQSELPENQDTTSMLVLGKDTEKAYRLISALRDKIDEFFNYCWLFTLQPTVKVDTPSLTMDKFLTNDANLMQEDRMRLAPLSTPSGDETLVFDDRINPVFRELISEFREVILKRLKADKKINNMTQSEWEDIKNLFAPYAAWIARKQGGGVGCIRIDTIDRYLTSDYADRLRTLMRNDRSVADELRHVDNVERLIVFQRWLMEFANNYVCLASLYDPLKPSLIQMGTLIMDGRRFELTMKVFDQARHKMIVQQSNICVMYLIVSRKKDNDIREMEVAAAVTSGTMTHLFIGKAGIFFTRDGLEWDATVVDIIPNPVSIIEAVKKPFKQLAEFTAKQTERFSDVRYQEVESRLEKSITTAEQSLSSQGQGAVGKQSILGSQLRDVMLSGGIALAALGSSFAYITKTLQNVSPLKMLTVVAGLVTVIFAPIILVTMFKLRRRNLSAFLEACGWAVNGQMHLSPTMGLLFTHEPDAPREFRRGRIDSLDALLKRIPIKSYRSVKWIILTITGILLGFGIYYLFTCWTFLAYNHH